MSAISLGHACGPGFAYQGPPIIELYDQVRDSWAPAFSPWHTGERETFVHEEAGIFLELPYSGIAVRTQRVHTPWRIVQDGEVLCTSSGRGDLVAGSSEPA